MTEEEYQNLKLTDDKDGLWLDGKLIMGKEELRPIQTGVNLINKKIKIKKVLELGFGYGYSADIFQKIEGIKHVIIEAHPEVFKRAKKWSEGKRVKLIYDFWQNVKLTDKFDLIYLDTYEMVHSIQDPTKKFSSDYLSIFASDEMSNIEEYQKYYHPFKIQDKKYYQLIFK